MSPEPVNLTVPWGYLTGSATRNRVSAGHGVISMPENDDKSFFLLLNLIVPWGLLTQNASANRPSAGRSVIRDHKTDSNSGFQSVPGIQFVGRGYFRVTSLK